MCGKMLWALFLPQDRRDCFQKFVSCCSSAPLGRRYNTYSLGRGSSRKGSSKWEKSLELRRQGCVQQRSVTFNQLMFIMMFDFLFDSWGNVCVCRSHQSHAAWTFLPPVDTNDFNLQKTKTREERSKQSCWIISFSFRADLLGWKQSGENEHTFIMSDWEQLHDLTSLPSSEKQTSLSEFPGVGLDRSSEQSSMSRGAWLRTSQRDGSYPGQTSSQTNLKWSPTTCTYWS